VDPRFAARGGRKERVAGSKLQGTGRGGPRLLRQIAQKVERDPPPTEEGKRISPSITGVGKMSAKERKGGKD